jgi:hypothetical protein
MTATARPPVPADDGSAEVARWYALEGARSFYPGELAELHATEFVRTSCAFCPEWFEGTFEDGRAWFADHRATAHPDRD